MKTCTYLKENFTHILKSFKTKQILQKVIKIFSSRGKLDNFLLTKELPTWSLEFIKHTKFSDCI